MHITLKKKKEEKRKQITKLKDGKHKELWPKNGSMPAIEEPKIEAALTWVEYYFGEKLDVQYTS